MLSRFAHALLHSHCGAQSGPESIPGPSNVIPCWVCIGFWLGSGIEPKTELALEGPGSHYRVVEYLTGKLSGGHPSCKCPSIEQESDLYCPLVCCRMLHPCRNFPIRQNNQFPSRCSTHGSITSEQGRFKKEHDVNGHGKKAARNCMPVLFGSHP